ncbi:hypothetical protein [Thioclava sp. GXIMD4216]|uniref:hypothetical protein n=1 Tax=Thioclava sp. GXIMD4216 TaxID=3131929 RepID=UPI0030D44F62
MNKFMILLPFLLWGCGHTPEIASRIAPPNFLPHLPDLPALPDLPRPALMAGQEASGYIYNGQMITFSEIDHDFDEDAPAGENYAQARGLCSDHGFDFVEYWGVTDTGQRFFCTN